MGGDPDMAMVRRANFSFHTVPAKRTRGAADLSVNFFHGVSTLFGGCAPDGCLGLALQHDFVYTGLLFEKQAMAFVCCGVGIRRYQV